MKKSGPDFYDEAGVFDFYQSHRARAETPNNTIEQPILWDLIGKPVGLDILDLGCGDAAVAEKFRQQEAKSYLGVEGSERMFQLALERINPQFATVQRHWLENYTPPESAFDLVVSSLALHYVENLTSLFRRVHRALRPDGRFIFSVEHPVITSCNKSLENTALRQAWIVDHYFERGERNVDWMGSSVTKFHRTIEDFLSTLTEAGFKFQRLRESDPPREHFLNEDLWTRRKRIPLFLFLSATKE